MSFSEIPRVVITLDCNFHCQFCPMDMPKRSMLDADKWIEIINSIPGASVIFTGGEPTLHPELARIINTVDKTDVRIYTNMSFKPEFLDELKKPVAFYGSFHPGAKQDPRDVAARAELAVAKGHRIISIHMNVAAGRDKSEFDYAFKSHGVDLQIEPDLFESPAWKEMKANPQGYVSCTMPRVLLGPDGKRYHCIAKLEIADPTGLVGKEFPSTVTCNQHGNCSACDVGILAVEKIEPAHLVPVKKNIFYGNKVVTMKCFKGDHFEKFYKRTAAFYEQDLLDAIKDKNLKGVYVDIGANIGNHSLFFAKFCPSDSVIAVEPVPEFCELVKKNAKANGQSKKVRVLQNAASKKTGETLYLSGFEPGILGTTRTVQHGIQENLTTTISVDDLKYKYSPRKRIGVLKIDVEGQELNVLKGARDVLEKDKPLVITECWHDDAKDEIGELLKPLGYRNTGRYCATPTYVWEVD